MLCFGFLTHSTIYPRSKNEKWIVKDRPQTTSEITIKKREDFECKNSTDDDTEPIISKQHPGGSCGPQSSSPTVQTQAGPLVKIFGSSSCHQLAIFNHLPSNICPTEQQATRPSFCGYPQNMTYFNLFLLSAPKDWTLEYGTLRLTSVSLTEFSQHIRSILRRQLPSHTKSCPPTSS